MPFTGAERFTKKVFGDPLVAFVVIVTEKVIVVVPGGNVTVPLAAT